MTSYERVVRAIEFNRPDKTPVWNINKDEPQGDVLKYDLRLYDDVTRDSDWRKGNLSEWGYVWHSLSDGTMGQPVSAIINSDEDFDRYRLPEINEDVRFAGLADFMAGAAEHYRLAMYVINGFTTYTFLRGFENALIDFSLRKPRAIKLLKEIFEFEKELMRCCKRKGFHGFHIGDDWGTQQGLIISPKMWDEIFAPLYKDLIDEAHKQGMHIWFHSCGNVTHLATRLHDIGVDVLNIAQPNVVDIEHVSKSLKGKQCFLIPISYQTTSISGTQQQIYADAKMLYNAFSAQSGGFIGYVEEYGCMGMSEENYKACREAFARL